MPSEFEGVAEMRGGVGAVRGGVAVSVALERRSGSELENVVIIIIIKMNVK